MSPARKKVDILIKVSCTHFARMALAIAAATFPLSSVSPLVILEVIPLSETCYDHGRLNSRGYPMRSILHSRGAILAGQLRQHFFAVFCLFLLLPGVHGFAATGTATALTVTSGGSAVTTVAAGNVIALTATVTSGGTALTTGQINFCDASVTYCTDIHSLGTAQLTSAGTAVVRLMPGIGSHSYKAVFAGTNAYSTSSSASSSLAVTLAGPYPTATTITSSGSAGSYTLTASVALEPGAVCPFPNSPGPADLF